MRTQTAAISLLTLLSLAVSAPAHAEVDPQLKGIRIAVPKAVGQSGDGRGAIVGRLQRDLKEQLGMLITDQEMEAGWRALKLKPSDRYTIENLQKLGKQVRAHYVLYVEVSKRGWLYTAQARLINSDNGEVQMDFRSGYYQPQLEAADRGDRIAKTTVDKLKVLVAQGSVKVRAEDTAQIEAGAKPEPPKQPGVEAPVEPGKTPEEKKEEIAASSDARDADVFGSADAGAGEGGDDRNAAIFGGVSGGSATIVPGSAIDDRLETADRRLAIGGQIYLRLQHQSFEEGDFLDQFPLTSPNLFDLFVDARPNSHLRAYAQARLAVNFTTTPTTASSPTPLSQSKVILDQLWLNFDAEGRVFFTLGRKRIKYGTGRFWNPTDFLNPVTLDPLAIFDERTGVDLATVHVPIESLGWNLYAIGSVGNAAVIDDLAFTARAEILLGTTELAVTFYTQKNKPFRLGVDGSGSLGPFDLHAEFALLKGGFGRFWEGTFDPVGGVLPTPRDREGDFIPQVVGGLEIEIPYSELDNIFLGAEYFYNGAGYSDSELLPWILLQGDFKPFYTGTHYAAVYIGLPNPGDWNDTSFNLSGIGNLSDLSFTTRLDYQVKILTYLDFDAFASLNFGQVGEFRLRVKVPAVPGLPGFENAIDSPAVVFAVGTGFSVKF